MSAPRSVATLRPAVWPGDAAAVRGLLRDYAASLSVDLGFQDFEAELAGLPGDYAPPGGVLMLAFVDDVPAACGALRPLSGVAEADASEMKRLYVRPPFRGLGLGRALAEALLAQARRSDRSAVYLDTLAEMADAQGLYVRLGFVDVPPYRFNPVAGTRFMKIRLGPATAPGESGG